MITASPYIDGKYANIEQGISLPPRNVSVLNAPASPPSNLTAQEKIVVINGKAVSRIIVEWKPSVGVIHYQFQ